MATGPENYLKAEALLKRGGRDNIARAQAHATLAAAAATIEQTVVMLDDNGTNGVMREWLDVVTLRDRP